MRAIQFIPTLLVLFLARTGDHHDDDSESLEEVYHLLNRSVTLRLPKNWVVDEDPCTFGKLIIVSDSALKSVHAPAEGAMGVFKVDIVADARSPTDILASKLYDEGGPPNGVDIETLTINDHPAARMSALDELFGEQYLWHATVIQFGDEIVVYVEFTGLGVYENNGVIDSVVKTISVDSAAFKAILKTRTG